MVFAFLVTSTLCFLLKFCRVQVSKLHCNGRYDSPTPDKAYLGEVVDDTLVEVLTTKVGITARGKHLEDALVDGKERDIKSATAEIVHNDVTFTGICLVQTISDSGGRGFVDDPENIETGNDTSILGGLALVVVEVGRDRDNGVRNLFAKIGLGDLLHLAKNHGRDLFGSEGLLLASHLDGDHGLVVLGGNLVGEVLDIRLDILFRKLPSDKTLDVEDSVVRVGSGLILGSVTDKSFIFGKSDVRGRYPVSYT
jgi:hypothetical protein